MSDATININTGVSLNTLLTGIQSSIVSSNKKNSDNYISNFSSYFTNNNDILIPNTTKFSIPKVNNVDVVSTVAPLPVGSIMLNNKNVIYGNTHWNLYKIYNPQTKEVNTLVYEINNNNPVLSDLNKFNEQIELNERNYDIAYGKYDKTLHNILFNDNINYNWIDYEKDISVNILLNTNEFEDNNAANTELNNLNNIKLDFSNKLESYLTEINYISLPSDYNRVDTINESFFDYEESIFKENLKNGIMQEKVFLILKDSRSQDNNNVISNNLTNHFLKLSIKNSIDLPNKTELTNDDINNLNLVEWIDVGIRENEPGDNYSDANIQNIANENISELTNYRNIVNNRVQQATTKLYSLGIDSQYMHMPSNTSTIPVIQIRGKISDLKNKLESIKDQSFINKFFYIRHPEQQKPQTSPLLDVSDIMSDNTANEVVDVQGWKATNIRVGVFEGSPGNETKDGVSYIGYDNIKVEEYYDPSKDPGSSSHATTVIGIIKNTSGSCIAPDAKIYSANDYSYDSLEWAITGKECRVINQSFHEAHEVDTGELSWEDILKDYLVLQYPYPFITSAAGNYSSTPETSNLSVPSDEYCNHKGYNYICVGNHDDFDSSGNPNGMRASSVFRNPDSSHNDRELPEMCANGTSVKLFDQSRGSGTSFSSPAVAGAAALLQNMDNLLLYWPEGIRAILFSGTTHNIVDNNWSTDVRIIDGKDGVGALDVNTSGKIAQRRSSKDNSPCPRGWHCGVINDSAFGEDNLTTYSYWIGVPYNFNDQDNTKRNVKVALAWNSEITNYTILGIDTGIRKSSDLKIDLDLEVYDSSGNLVGYSNTWDNSYEVVEFMGNVNEKYEIKIRRWSGTGHSSYYGIAWNAGDGIFINYNKVLVPYDITNLIGYISGSLSNIISNQMLSSNNTLSLSSLTGSGATVVTGNQGLLTLLDGGSNYHPTDALVVNTNTNNLVINSNLNSGNILYPNSNNVLVAESVSNANANISNVLSVPNATLSSHKQLNIDNLDVNFNVNINSISENDVILNTNVGENNGNISLKISSNNEPESVSRLMDYLQNGI